MEYYQLIKHIHVTTAVLSLLGFALRGWWMVKESSLLQHKLVKILPHVNDTLLLTAAIFLSLMSGLYPFVEGWLGAKVVLLIGYIVAGIFALKRGKTRHSRLIALLIALLCISMIFGLAIFKPVY